MSVSVASDGVNGGVNNSCCLLLLASDLKASNQAQWMETPKHVCAHCTAGGSSSLFMVEYKSG